MLYQLEAYNTDSRCIDDIRYRAYTTSEKKAKMFEKIPKIQFTDSGHGIVFVARPVKKRNQPIVNTISEYVFRNLKILNDKYG